MDANSAATNGCCFGTLSFRKILDSNKPYTPFCMSVPNQTYIFTYTCPFLFVCVDGQMFEQMMAAKSGTYEPENYSTTSIYITAITTTPTTWLKKGCENCIFYF